MKNTVLIIFALIFWLNASSQNMATEETIEEIRKTITRSFPDANKDFIRSISDTSILSGIITSSGDTIYQVNSYNKEFWVSFLILFPKINGDATIIIDLEFQSSTHFSFFGKKQLSKSEVYAFEYISISDGMQSYYLYESNSRKLYKVTSEYDTCHLNLSSFDIKTGSINCGLEGRTIDLELTLLREI